MPAQDPDNPEFPRPIDAPGVSRPGQAASEPVASDATDAPRPRTRREDGADPGGDSGSGVEMVIPLAQEQLRVEKRQVEAGRIEVDIRVLEHLGVADVPLATEEVDVERRVIDRAVDGPTPTVRTEGDVVIVPILEEVMVVEKRQWLREELRITRRRREVHRPQQVPLRREEAEVRRYEAPAQPPGPLGEREHDAPPSAEPARPGARDPEALEH